jgi:sarcosine oxidase/L-pipecolate oxidase
VQAGVEFVLGDPQGKLESLITEHSGPEKKVTGIKTCDNQSHYGDLVIVAGMTISPAYCSFCSMLMFFYSWRLDCLNHS